MNGHWKLTGLTLLGLIGLFGLISLAQGVAPKGIIPTPPESQALQVRIWVDKGVYTVGESITIHYRVNKQAYVYIWDIEPDGTANPLFPNTRQGGNQNYVGPGEHVVPGGWQIAPPLGTEYLQILATTTPIDLFSFMTSDPEAFRKQVEAHVMGVVPANERSWDFTSFKIVSGTPPPYGTLVVNSTPSLAQVYLDGVYVGYTPRTFYVAQGYHQIIVRKSGYKDWTRGVFIIGGFTRTINVTLQPSAPVNQPPVAAFSYSPANPMVGGWVRFDGSASFDPDGTITAYNWNFGDGTTASGVIRYHQFTAAGTYTVTLTVTDNNWVTNSTSQTIQVGPTNQPPVAAFDYTPLAPRVGEAITLNAAASYDPDGTITAYRWDLDNNGVDDATGQIFSVRYYNPGPHPVRLTVVDNQGLSGSTTRTINVLSGGIPGGPAMDGIPGIFVWGTDTWHITVNAGSGWTSPHAYRLELRTDGSFTDVNRSTSGGVSPMGIIPSPSGGGKTIVFDGNLQQGSVDYTFKVAGSKSIYMSLKLDVNGDGTLDESPGFVHLRGLMVNPPFNPFVIGLPSGSTGPLVPSMNFRIGQAVKYTEHVRFIFWFTDISTLEGS